VTGTPADELDDPEHRPAEPDDEDAGRPWWDGMDDLSEDTLLRLGFSPEDVEVIYASLSPEQLQLPQSAPAADDDASQALETARNDQVPPTPALDMGDLERAHREGQIESDRQDTGLRKLLAIWSIAAASVMLVLGTGIFLVYMWSEWKEVPSQAIIAWLSASVLEVLGIVYVVANYLCPRSKDE
jgi:hypothetical protein